MFLTGATLFVCVVCSGLGVRLPLPGAGAALAGTALPGGDPAPPAAGAAEVTPDGAAPRLAVRDLAWDLPLSAVHDPLSAFHVHAAPAFHVHAGGCAGPELFAAKGAPHRRASAWMVTFRMTTAQFTLLRQEAKPVLCQERNLVAELEASVAWSPHHVFASYIYGYEGRWLTVCLELLICLVGAFILLGILRIAADMRGREITTKAGPTWLVYGVHCDIYRALDVHRSTCRLTALVTGVVLLLIGWLGNQAQGASILVRATSLAAVLFVFGAALFLAFSVVLRQALSEPFAKQGYALVFRKVDGYSSSGVRVALVLATIAGMVASVEGGAATRPNETFPAAFFNFFPFFAGLAVLWLALEAAESRLLAIPSLSGQVLIWAEQVIAAARTFSALGSDMTVDQVLRVALELSGPMCEELLEEEEELDILDAKDSRTEGEMTRADRLLRNVLASERNVVRRERNRAVREALDQQRAALHKQYGKEAPLVPPVLEDVKVSDSAWALPQAHRVVATNLVLFPLLLVALAVLALGVTVVGPGSAELVKAGGNVAVPWGPGHNTLLVGHGEVELALRGADLSLEKAEGLDREQILSQTYGGVLHIRVPAHGPGPVTLTINAGGFLPSTYDVTMLPKISLAFLDIRTPEATVCLPLSKDVNQHYVPDSFAGGSVELSLWTMETPFMPQRSMEPSVMRSGEKCDCGPGCAYAEQFGDRCYRMNARASAGQAVFCSPRMLESTRNPTCAPLAVAGLATGTNETSLLPVMDEKGVTVYRGSGRLKFHDGVTTIVAGLSHGTRVAELRTGQPDFKFGLERVVSGKKFLSVASLNVDGELQLCAAHEPQMRLLVQRNGELSAADEDGRPLAPTKITGAHYYFPVGAEKLHLRIGRHTTAVRFGDPASCTARARKLLAMGEVVEGIALLRGTVAEFLDLGKINLPPADLAALGRALPEHVKRVGGLPRADLSGAPLGGGEAAVAFARRGVPSIDLSNGPLAVSLEALAGVDTLVLRNVQLQPEFMPKGDAVLSWRVLDVAGAVQAAGGSAERGLFLGEQTFPSLSRVVADGADLKLVEALLANVGDATPELTDLSIMRVHMTSFGLASVWPKLLKPCRLWIDDAVGDEPLTRALTVASAAKDSWVPLELSLRSAGLTSRGLQALTALAERRLLRTLDLRGNAVPAAAAEMLLDTPLARLVVDPQLGEPYKPHARLIVGEPPISEPPVGEQPVEIAPAQESGDRGVVVGESGLVSVEREPGRSEEAIAAPRTRIAGAASRAAAASRVAESLRIPRHSGSLQKHEALESHAASEVDAVTDLDTEQPARRTVGQAAGPRSEHASEAGPRGDPIIESDEN